MSFKTLRFFPLISLVSLSGILSSCSYFIDTSTQPVHVETPGAQSAHCYLIVDDLKYQANPPQTINIKKSKRDMKVECKAPGNRSKSMVLSPGVEEAAYWNLVNGIVPGTAVDFASDAMFKWPDLIVVDFTDVERQESPLPDYNNPDVKQPEDYNLEEYLPARPRLNSDRYLKPVEIKRRESLSAYDESFDTPSPQGAAMDSKASPMKSTSKESSTSFIPSDLIVPGSVSSQNNSVRDAVSTSDEAPLYPVE